MSDINRRNFAKVVIGAAAVGALSAVETADAAPKRFGKLVDSTICIGCKRCMSACKRWNNLKVTRGEMLTDKETELSPEDFTVVNWRRDAKNRDERTYLKWQCQHCIKPACVGACPVKAVTKLPNGPVVINEKKCIGCMYCYQSCPYKIPRFSFKKRVARKCTLCYDRITIKVGMKPSCVAACPVQALSFGPKDEIIREAKARVDELGNDAHILGLTESGGTDVLTISWAKATDLGLIIAPNKVVNNNLDKIRISASGIMGASAMLGVIFALAEVAKHKNNHSTENEEKQNDE